MALRPPPGTRHPARPLGLTPCLVFAIVSAIAFHPAGAQETPNNGTGFLESLVPDRVTGKKSPSVLSDAAARLLAGGDHATACRFWERAIRANPSDAGRQYRQRPVHEVDDESLEHGFRQVDLMLGDRPRMKLLLGPDDDRLVAWAARKFAGEDLGFTIDWSPARPQPGADAEHEVPYGTTRGAIRVSPEFQQGPREGEPMGFEPLWAAAIYELHNIAHASEFLALHERAIEGTITRDEYIRENFLVELKAIQETRAFYVFHFLPWMDGRGLTSDSTLWYTAYWGSPDDWLRDVYFDPEGYPWVPYGPYFDEYEAWRARSFQNPMPDKDADDGESPSQARGLQHDRRDAVRRARQNASVCAVSG